MNSDEARSILSAYRPEDADDPLFAEALKEVAADPELAQWWANEQLFDRAIASKVQSMPVPAGLKSRLLQMTPGRPEIRRNWGRQITLLAATIAIFAVLFSSWRGPFQPAVSLADYRDEMVTLVKVPLPLELENSDLSQLLARVEESGGLSDISIPPKLRKLEAKGCRMLRFHGHDVGLICFNRANGRRAHLFVVASGALAPLSGAPGRVYAAQGEWMTAAWSENGHTYLLAVQGDRKALDEYLSSA